MRDVLPAFAKDVIDVDELGVRGVGHAVVANEDDVEYVGQVTCLDRIMQFAGEDVDLLQNFLYTDVVTMSKSI